MIWPQDWQRTTYWWQQPVHSWLWSWERTNCTTATSHWLHCHYRQTATWRMNIHITGWPCSHWRYVFHWRYVWIFISLAGPAVTEDLIPCRHDWTHCDHARRAQLVDKQMQSKLFCLANFSVTPCTGYSWAVFARVQPAAGSQRCRQRRRGA